MSAVAGTPPRNFELLAKDGDSELLDVCFRSRLDISLVLPYCECL